ncbi:hypothetical protein [Nonomuraea dietziae]|uniref:Uncharacterized protein n=1 Tax=Nonomuraea dietziae TaxID=65515 RepID=A0A7W5YCX4_9ACTN|nr:hypothetical protein [Nonomuraea dietziae]MBB3729788.1 hypothetical protein [Nonomuraea dietziae]
MLGKANYTWYGMYEVRGPCAHVAWSSFWRKLIPSRKAKIYAELGLDQPSQRKVLITASSDQHHIGEDFVSEGRVEPFAYLLERGERWLDLDRVN